MYDIFSQIFPPIRDLPEAASTPGLREEILEKLLQNEETAESFRNLSKEAQEALLGFCMGSRGLKITYDPFFQHIFDPVRHPRRLDSLLSAILNQPVHVRKVLPRERRRISEDSSLIIMDILVQISDGSLVNVEMQRIGYDFPSERCFCYGADLLLRQFDIVRGEQGKKFSYRAIQPVYVIVLMEKSPGIFHQMPDRYLHRSNMIYDTGLKMNNLLNFVYIPLDIFRQMPHNELTETEAWLYFLGSDDPRDILRLTDRFPMFRQLYQEIVDFRYHPKELISMYSDALRILDQNTVKYMIDELKGQVAELARQKAESDAALAKQTAENQQLRQLLAKYEDSPFSSATTE